MTDSDYIQAVRSGDTAAFKPIVERYQQLVFRTAMGFLHHQEEAEDITQDIFIKVWQSLNRFSGESAFSTWIYRITVNHCLNHLRQKKRNDLFSFAEDLFQQLINKPEEEAVAEDEIEERDQHIRKAIDSLSDKQRTAFVLSRYEELPQKEIARIMNTSEGSVEQHLQRAKKNLQNKLAHLVGK